MAGNSEEFIALFRSWICYIFLNFETFVYFYSVTELQNTMETGRLFPRLHKKYYISTFYIQKTLNIFLINFFLSIRYNNTAFLTTVFSTKSMFQQNTYFVFMDRGCISCQFYNRMIMQKSMQIQIKDKNNLKLADKPSEAHGICMNFNLFSRKMVKRRVECLSFDVY